MKRNSLIGTSVLAALALALGQHAASAAPATATGPAALALAAVVAEQAPLGRYEKRVITRLFDGDSNISITPNTKITVAAMSIVCRTSNVDITMRSCDLTFKTNKRSVHGRLANELFATITVAGVASEGAAGSIVVIVLWVYYASIILFLGAEFTKVYDVVRQDRPGWSSRDDHWWAQVLVDSPGSRDGATERRVVVHEGEGGVDGYALWRSKSNWNAGGPNAEVWVTEIAAADPVAYAALWRFLASQVPNHDPEHQPLPFFADRWLDRHARGDDVVRWYSSMS